MKRIFLYLPFLLLYSCSTNTPDQTTAEQKPNILIIQPDQLRADMLGCAGHPDVKTPNIDRLAAQGIRFSHAVSGGPVCCPFRATFQTGMYIHEHGVPKNNVLLNPEHTTFAEVLVEHGYTTGYIGKWHLDGGTPPEVGGYVEEGERRQGWQDWHGYEKAHEFFEVWDFDENKKKVSVEGYDWEPTWQTDMALKFINKQTENDLPWCYYLAYGPPHNPLQCPEEFLDIYPEESLHLSPDLMQTLTPEEEKEVRRIRQIYYGQVTAIDLEIGRLMAGLKDLAIAENTIIFFVSDHGDVLGAHTRDIKNRDERQGRPANYNLRTKGKPYITALQIPFIVSWPGTVPAGQVKDALVNSVDLAPTLLDLAGVLAPENMSGQSMAAWCTSDSGPKNGALYLGLYKDKNAWRGVWDGRYLYANLDYQVLYDHREDPHELTNLFDNPDSQEVQAKMEQMLIELARSTGDPILPRLEKAIALNN